MSAHAINNNENGTRGIRYKVACAYADAMGAEDPDLLAAWIVEGVGGSDTLFLDHGKVVEHIERPVFLIGVSDSYAIYMTGESMEPRYLASQLLFVNPGRPLSRGCFIVIQKTNDEALVKSFVSQCDGVITVEQFNPEGRIKIPHEELAAVHRIIGSREG